MATTQLGVIPTPSIGIEIPLHRIIAHEMRHYLSVLTDGIAHLSVTNTDRQNLDSATRNLHHLIDSLRFGTTPHPEQIDLTELLWEQLAFLELTSAFTIETDIPEHPVYLFADPYQLGRCILNLLLNAIEACQQTGSVFITCRELHHHVTVTIRDTGCGMTADQLSMMWTPLYTTKPNGTGLGAHIARQIINNHGGSITADSIPGAGTTIHIELPINNNFND